MSHRLKRLIKICISNKVLVSRVVTEEFFHVIRYETMAARLVASIAEDGAEFHQTNSFITIKKEINY